MSIHPQKSAQTSHILGIDFGKSKLGLALADTETRIAFGYDTIKNDKNLLAKLAEIVAKEKIDQVIIGIPGHMDRPEEGDEKALGKLLEANMGVQVYYVEEMFTTKMAQANLREKGAKHVGKIDDKEAARIILQSWLDK